MDELLSNFGRSIKSARQAAGLTQEDLAIQSEVTSRYIIAIENESKYPSMHVLLKIIRINEIELAGRVLQNKRFRNYFERCKKKA